MAFQNKNMSVITYANGFTQWHYNTDETLESVIGTGYFNNIKTLTNTGDFILLNTQNGSAILVVSQITPDEVSIKIMNKIIY